MNTMVKGDRERSLNGMWRGLGAARFSAKRSLMLTTAYPYSGMAYSDPDALTSLGNGLSTTTYTYDNDGNLSQSGLFTYLYDYLNRITSLGLGFGDGP